MSLALDVIAALLITLGALFYFAGTVGLLRFPDVYCRLHALTKADNLGLGLTSTGLILLAPDWAARFQILLVWLLVLASSATICHILAKSSLDQGIPAVGPPPSLPDADAPTAPPPGDT